MESNDRTVVDRTTPEHLRIATMRENPDGWRLWGPYLSERAWGTVREDYSADGSAWDYLPHDHARSRAYRWNEDGLGGICDIRQRLCFAVAVWNGVDPILKERLFGLGGPEGNHGEDVKEYYYYLDSTPSHSYLKFLYKYPQRAFPYTDLVDENKRRNRHDPEYELVDTGVFDENRYFDIQIEYAKASETDMYIKITAHNRGDHAAPIWILPHLWFRNTWDWQPVGTVPLPEMHAVANPPKNTKAVRASADKLGSYFLICDADAETGGVPELLFTENETNNERIFQSPNRTPYVKDAIHRAVVDEEKAATNPAQKGTKMAAAYATTLEAGASFTIRMRLCRSENPGAPIPTLPNVADFDVLFATRIAEADAFYKTFETKPLTDESRRVQRQAFAGLLWSKQFYHFDIERWLDGDPTQPTPPQSRKSGRNNNWCHVSVGDVLLMPDAWEYPWFAAWDLAFHTITVAMVDPDLAKHQLILMCREWYMHPNGQLPAYEWAFGDVNPPVHAWAALRVYQIERRWQGKSNDEAGDTDFLERIFQKLMLNFTWWVNQKDKQGNNVFEGGFLGLDNVGIFDRSAVLPDGGYIEQCDGTSWMAMYCLNMLAIALELSRHDPTYQDVATKFAEHFMYIAHALNTMGGDGVELWSEQDGFYYDVLHLPDGTHIPLNVRSIVGLTPLFAVEAFTSDALANVPEFLKRIDWFLTHKPHIAQGVANMVGRDMDDNESRSGQSMMRHLQTNEAINTRALFSILSEERLRRILQRLFDENEFLSPHGIRSLSKAYSNIFSLRAFDSEYTIHYDPAESSSGLFGGNSNWRGPIWFPMNFLLIEALQRYNYVYGDMFMVEFPTGSGKKYTLGEIAELLSQRLIGIFLPDEKGRRPVHGDVELFQHDPHWRDNLLFYEYFHGENGRGLGASHQTGWTALVAKLIEQA